MVHRTYIGIDAETAVREFDAMRAHIAQLCELQAECVALGPDHDALGIAIDGAETAAYHFTRGRNYYEDLRVRAAGPAGGNGRLKDRREAVAAFEAFWPYAAHLRQLQRRCRPFGRDYLALAVAHKSLETAAYHFTRIAAFYGDKADASGAIRRSTEAGP